VNEFIDQSAAHLMLFAQEYNRFLLSIILTDDLVLVNFGFFIGLELVFSGFKGSKGFLCPVCPSQCINAVFS
jgi:hypothetical protein